MSEARPDDRPVLLVVHQEHSTPGRIGQTLEALGLRLDIRRSGFGEPLPDSLEGHRGVVVFGGPMSANDDHLPFIRRELELIPRVLAAGTPFLGVCLGGQLLARALGASVGPHPEGWHEIGFYDLRPEEAGQTLFARQSTFFQWHGEGFDLPRGAVRLASSRHFPNQCFRYGPAAYAIQFHPEMTADMVRLWGSKAGHRLVQPGAQCRSEHRRLLALHHDGVGLWLHGFLRDWLQPGRSAAAAGGLAAAAG
ncbi:MAG: hypothetical protein RIB84_22225 [Sneathiellaceae bacterium]